MHPQEHLLDYALDTLEAPDLTRVEAHLETCGTCRTEVRQLRASLVSLTESLPPVAPPPRVWAGIEAALAKKRTATITAPDTTPNTAPPAAAPTQPERTTPTRSGPTRSTFHPPRPAATWLLAACLAVLCVTSLLWGYRNQQNTQAREAEQRLVAHVLARPGVETAVLENPSGDTLGSVLLTPDGEAVFVLEDAPPGGRAYQAWGHIGDTWQRGRDPITSLRVSDRAVFAVSWQGYGSLYLSLEPPQGSVEPTDALSRVSLQSIISRPAERAITVTTPGDGAVLGRDRVIVSGTLARGVRELRYALNDAPPTETFVSGNNFSFTVTGLREGENTLTLSATLADDEVTETVTVRYAPTD